MEEFRKELRDLINKHSLENASDTPDFILAKYLSACLRSFDLAVKERDNWYRPDLEVSRRQFIHLDL